jgi:hypothetical protein
MMDDLVPIKKVVRYHQLRDCIVGRRASVWPIDHPDIPAGKSGRTSVVQMFDPLTGVAETTYSRYEPGLFAEWSEVGEDSIYGHISNNTTVAASMPSSFSVKVKDFDQESAQQTYYPHFPTPASLGLQHQNTDRPQRSA